MITKPLHMYKKHPFFSEMVTILNSLDGCNVYYQNKKLDSEQLVIYAYLLLLVKMEELKIAEDLFNNLFFIQKEVEHYISSALILDKDREISEALETFYHRFNLFDLSYRSVLRFHMFSNVLKKNTFCQEVLTTIARINSTETFPLENFFVCFSEQNNEEKAPSNEQSKIKNNEKTYLKKYGHDMTTKKNLTNPAIGRESELRNLMVSLLTPEKSAIVIGDAGVGKTALIEGLAFLINTDSVPDFFKDKQIIKLNISSIVEGSRYLGTFEEKLQNIIDELIENEDIILFIDEIHAMIGAGTTSKSNLDVANILKPFLDRGKIKIIGATTYNEYKKYIEKDEAIKRRFEPIFVKEPDEETLKIILNSAIEKYEEQTNVVFDFSYSKKLEIINIICEITRKNNRNIYDYINNPDLALTILAKSFAFAKLDSLKNVGISHIIESINSSYRIVEIYKNKYIRMLNLIKEEVESDTKEESNIVQFVRKK